MIAGLPRSGSTLLSSILNQNPRFHSGISNPLNEAMHNAINAFSITGNFTQMTQQQRVNVLNGMIDGYYKDIDAEVAFNTSRTWTSYLDLIDLVRPEAKVICCVREIAWVLDSFETLRRKDPTLTVFLGDSSEFFIKNDVYTRANWQFNSGVVAVAYHSLQQGYHSTHTNKLYFVEYDDLAKNPERTMRGVYNIIGEPYYDHDYDDVEISYDEYDVSVAMPGLHKIRKKVQHIQRPSILPRDLFESYTNKGYEFWRQ